MGIMQRLRQPDIVDLRIELHRVSGIWYAFNTDEYIGIEGYKNFMKNEIEKLKRLTK